MAGIEEVAKLAGVSTATVSRALSGRGHVSPASKAKVDEAAARLGYVVSSNASSLASGRTRNIGVVIPFLNRWFFSSVLEGAQQSLLRSGYDLTLYNLSGDGQERSSVFEHFLLRQRVDAVIAVSLELTEPEVARLHELGKPLVGVGGPIPGVRTLTIDDAGIEIDQRLFAPADFTIRGGYHAAKQLLGVPHDRPTAIFAASDEMAIGSILAARDLGLVVPRDVSIVGIDDHDLSDFFGLSTVAQFPRLQGEKAVEILMEQLEPEADAPAHAAATPLPYELRVRSSTARPRER